MKGRDLLGNAIDVSFACQSLVLRIRIALPDAGQRKAAKLIKRNENSVSCCRALY